MQLWRDGPHLRGRRALPPGERSWQRRRPPMLESVRLRRPARPSQLVLRRLRGADLPGCFACTGRPLHSHPAGQPGLRRRCRMHAAAGPGAAAPPPVPSPGHQKRGAFSSHLEFHAVRLQAFGIPLIWLMAATASSALQQGPTLHKAQGTKLPTLAAGSSDLGSSWQHAQLHLTLHSPVQRTAPRALYERGCTMQLEQQEQRINQSKSTWGFGMPSSM